jgi:hypothetical protein
MFLDPVQHTVECPTGFSSLIDVLFLIVEIGIVDARCTGDEDIDITRNISFGTISGVTIL